MQSAPVFYVAEWGNHRVCEWDVVTGTFKKELHLPALRFPSGLCISPDDALLAVSDWGNHQVLILSTQEGSCLRSIQGVSPDLAVDNFLHPVCVCFSPDGCYVAVGDSIHFKVVLVEVGLHDPDSIGVCVQTIELGSSPGQTLCSVAFDPCDSVLFIHQGDVVRAIYLDHPSLLFESEFKLGPGAGIECSGVGIAIDANSGRVAIAERCATCRVLKKNHYSMNIYIDNLIEWSQSPNQYTRRCE
jgi:hypothetical protein